MYKAQLLFPGNSLHEKLLYTDGVRGRLSMLKPSMEARGWKSGNDAERATGLSQSIWYGIMRGKAIELATYLHIAEALGWDLSRDANWHYANVTYIPADLQRRIERLFPDENNYFIDCRYIDKELGLRAQDTWCNMSYSRSRNSLVFCRILQWISQQEKAAGFSDAMSIEY